MTDRVVALTATRITLTGQTGFVSGERRSMGPQFPMIAMFRSSATAERRAPGFRTLFRGGGA
jgi:hypothetical protein